MQTRPYLTLAAVTLVTAAAFDAYLTAGERRHSRAV